MTQWFRMYNEALDDPKVQTLPAEVFKGWVNLLCLAARHEGIVPEDTAAFSLRVSESQAAELISTLLAAGLFERTDDGLTPHNWHCRQYKSDGSNERVERYRKKRRDAGLPVLADYSGFKAGLVKRDGERCIYCLATAPLVVDHMVPIALGGDDDEENLGLACKGCNSGKAGRTPELANMPIKVTTAADALRRYRDKRGSVTVTVTPSETESDTETESESETPQAAPRRTRATRLPEDWKAEPAERLFAEQMGLNASAVEAAFRDYWVGVPGQRGCKLDWPATFRNWCRKERGSPQGRPVARTAPPPDPTAEPWEQRLAAFKRSGFWAGNWGGKPGERFCHVPPEILERHGYGRAA